MRWEFLGIEICRISILLQLLRQDEYLQTIIQQKQRKTHCFEIAMDRLKSNNFKRTIDYDLLTRINCVNITSYMSKYQIAALVSLGLGIGTAITIFLNRKQNPQAQPNHLSLQTTLKVAQQIKYQMIKVSLTFATEVASKLMKAIQPSQLHIAAEKLRENLVKIYEQKEGSILSKYEIQKEDYGLSLQQFQDDVRVKNIKESILQMIESAIKGEIPDLTVPEQALKLHYLQEIINVSRDIQSYIAVLVWAKITNLMRNDVSFNVKDQQHFKKMLRELDVYKTRVNFLVEKGYRQEWGCPNETFLKVVEIYKGENKDFSRRILAIEKAYETAIDVITSNPDAITKEEIKERIWTAQPVI